MKLEPWLLAHEINDTPTREKFAATIGVNIATLWRLRMGRSFPARKTAQAIFKATGGEVTLSDFGDAPSARRPDRIIATRPIAPRSFAVPSRQIAPGLLRDWRLQMGDVTSKGALKEAAHLLFEIAPKAQTRSERRLQAYRKLSKEFSFYRICQIDRQSSRVVITADELQVMREAAHGGGASELSRIGQRLDIVEAELANLREFRARHEEALVTATNRKRGARGV